MLAKWKNYNTITKRYKTIRRGKKKDQSKIDENYILTKINERINARKAGDFKLADQIRDDLLNKGIIIEDKQNKTEWKYK